MDSEGVKSPTTRSCPPSSGDHPAVHGAVELDTDVLAVDACGFRREGGGAHQRKHRDHRRLGCVHRFSSHGEALEKFRLFKARAKVNFDFFLFPERDHNYRLLPPAKLPISRCNYYIFFMIEKHKHTKRCIDTGARLVYYLRKRFTGNVIVRPTQQEALMMHTAKRLAALAALLLALTRPSSSGRLALRRRFAVWCMTPPAVLVVGAR